MFSIPLVDFVAPNNSSSAAVAALALVGSNQVAGKACQTWGLVRCGL